MQQKGGSPTSGARGDLPGLALNSFRRLVCDESQSSTSAMSVEAR